MNCTNEELESMKLIMQKKDIATFNANPANVYKEATEEQNRIWVKSVLEYQAEVNFLFQNWWDNATQKYKLDGEYQLDFNNGEFVKLN